jgi:hypothetical protein
MKNIWSGQRKGGYALSKLDEKTARVTGRLRHGIVRLLAPKLCGIQDELDEIVRATPRPMTLILKVHYAKRTDLVGTEIGVFKGENSISLLSELHIKTLYLIDPYMPYVDSGAKIRFCDTKDVYAIARINLKNYKQAKFMRLPSEEAAKEISEALDFVYIDGNHSYEFVKKDIELYWELLKHGGVIGGHDYLESYPGVRRAVDVFAEKERLRVFKLFPDWWIFKP